MERAVTELALQLHPVVPINTRETSDDGFLPYGGGTGARRGHVVTYDRYALHALRLSSDAPLRQSVLAAGMGLGLVGDTYR